MNIYCICITYKISPYYVPIYFLLAQFLEHLNTMITAVLCQLNLATVGDC